VARLVALLLVAVALAGCMHKPTPTTPTTPTTTRAPPPPNFEGNWSLAPGNFSLVLVKTHIDYYNRTTNETIPGAPCQALFSWSLQRENETLYLDTNHAIDPYQPGDLRVVFLHALITQDRCVRKGFYGINDNATTPDICLYGVPASQREGHRRPWECRLPVEPANDARASVWVNVSVPLTADSHSFDVNGHSFPSGEGGEFDFWRESESRDRRYHTTVTVEAVGVWPYGAIHRGATSGGE